MIFFKKKWRCYIINIITYIIMLIFMFSLIQLLFTYYLNIYIYNFLLGMHYLCNSSTNYLAVQKVETNYTSLEVLVFFLYLADTEWYLYLYTWATKLSIITEGKTNEYLVIPINYGFINNQLKNEYFKNL